MSELTMEEKTVIERLNHKTYSVEYIEGFLKRKPENVFANAPVALAQMGVSGYMDAVRAVVRMEEDSCIECESKTCCYNHEGECRFALVHDRKPNMTEDDGCLEGVFGG